MIWCIFISTLEAFCTCLWSSLVHLVRAVPGKVFCHETGLAVLRVLALTRNTYKNAEKAWQGGRALVEVTGVRNGNQVLFFVPSLMLGFCLVGLAETSSQLQPGLNFECLNIKIGYLYIFMGRLEVGLWPGSPVEHSKMLDETLYIKTGGVSLRG